MEQKNIGVKRRTNVSGKKIKEFQDLNPKDWDEIGKEALGFRMLQIGILIGKCSEGYNLTDMEKNILKLWMEKYGRGS